MLDLADSKYLLAIHRAMNLTSIRFRRLQGYFQSDWESAFNAPAKKLMEAGIDSKGIEKLLRNRSNIVPEREVDQLRACGASILILGKEKYPPSLAHIHNPPALLFYRGSYTGDEFPAIAVVGSRSISPTGQRSCTKLVTTLATAQITIVSGLAYGIDIQAHKISTKLHNKTIAVMANGIDTVYPIAHENYVFQELRSGNLILFSEYLPNTPAIPEMFPVRNRIVTGLSRATIVVQAALRSGSLISAELALDQNREVFAVPGDIFSPYSAGTNQLIANQKAMAVTSGEQILSELGLVNIKTKKEAQRSFPLSESEKQLLSFLSESDPIHIDTLSRQVKNAASIITMLELKGLITDLGTNTYVKNI